MLVGKTNVDTLVPADALDIKYHKIKEEDAWHVGVVKELTDVKFGEAYVDVFSRKELDYILKFVCVT